MVGQKASDKVGECICILEELYGLPEVDEIDPVDLLVRTILSQNTSDINSLRAFASLKRAYGDYESLLSTRAEEVAESIREGAGGDQGPADTGGSLADQERSGAIEIGFLRGWRRRRP